MQKFFHSASDRGEANHGWLQSRHTFSFAGYHNPERMNFGLLRVLNDDWVAPAMGFGTHPHNNMEIVTIPIEGALEHKDSMGNETIIQAGEVQRMSAGTGITHSEYNHSKDKKVNFLQIWILPKEKDIQPGYGQKKFEDSELQNKFKLVVSPDGRENSITINQDSYFSLSSISKDQSLVFTPRSKNTGAYFFLIDGIVEIAGGCLQARDALGLVDFSEVRVLAKENTKLLTIEVPFQ